MKEDPRANMRTITRKVKARVQAEDTAARLTHSTGLVVQGQTVRDFEGKDAEAWTSVVLSLLERIFKFALNATTDTLPHNKNLCLRRKLRSPTCPPLWSRPDPPPHPQQLPGCSGEEEV